MDGSHRRSALAAFFFFCLVGLIYLTTYRGTLQSDDEQLYAAVSQNLAFHRSLGAEQLLGNARIAGRFHGTGLSHVALGALSVLLLDFTPFGFVQGLLILPPLITALTATLALIYVRDTGGSLKLAVLTACVFAFASIAWGYSQTFYRETTAALCVMSSLYFGRRSLPLQAAAEKLLPLALFLLSLAGLILAKAVLILVVPGLLLALLSALPPGPSRRKNGMQLLGLVGLLALAAFLTARAVIPAALPTRYDFPEIIFLTLETMAALDPRRIASNALAAVVSPGYGLLFFSPLLLPGLFTWMRGSRAWRGLSAAAVWSVGIIVAIEAATTGSEGWNLSWGPRRLLPVLPMLLLAAVPAYQRLFNTDKTRLRALAFGVFAACVGVQLGGVLISKTLVREALALETGDFFSESLVWDLRSTPIAYTWKLLIAGVQPDLAVFRLFNTGSGGFTAMFMIAALIGIGTAAGGLARGVKAGPAGRMAAAGALCGVLLLTAPLLLLQAARDDPAYGYGARYLKAAAALEAVETEDAAVLVDYYLSPLWQVLLNHNGDRHIPWVSLPVPGQAYRPLQAAVYRAAVSRLSACPSIWIASENAEFQVSERYLELAPLLEGYSLVSVLAFNDRPEAPAVLLFHFRDDRQVACDSG